MRVNNPVNSASCTPVFSASFVRKVPVMKLNPDSMIYESTEADLIKLSPKCANDVNMAEKICFNDKFRSYGEYLFGMWTNKKWNFPFVKSNNLFGLVLSKDGEYDSLNINEVLGVTEFIENNGSEENKIRFMITNNDYQNNPENETIKEFKHIGAGMTDALKEIYPEKPISVFSDWDAVEFWSNQGFRKITQRKLIYNG